MPCLPISHENLAEVAKTYDPSKPVFMLNLWRYRDRAVYAPEFAHLSSGPCTGEEALKRYRAAITTVLPPNASVHFSARPLTSVIAPAGEKWDFLALIRYENLQGFRDMVASEKYKREVEPHRLAGLEDMRLICGEGVEG
ncbi:hypothetical protein FB567DRAFT_259347 [Paraphoma chrysanthemicola]|uniref:DUF1330 domain-containing protein n=1 Tax=Paraphoma chrysanthemicola TaxID=798071 RepID=A0A8K0QSW7_9PLEO|nr:hypothetical protein FB567DRAFT_259347 [Paraphoma chrysanthemicola]